MVTYTPSALSDGDSCVETGPYASFTLSSNVPPEPIL